MTQLSQRTWYHYCPPGTTIDTDVCYDQEFPDPEGLWLSSKGEPASWDTWRKEVDPKDEPLAEDLKRLFAVKLFDNARIYIASTDKPFDARTMADDYDGIYIPAGSKSVSGNTYPCECICLWDVEEAVTSIEDTPSPFLQQTP